MSEAYREAGVDLDLGNDVSRILYEAGKHTWANREGRYGEIRAFQDSFRGLRTWNMGARLLEVPEPEKIEGDQDADGTGTKLLVNQMTSRYDTAGFDLFAMAIDDPATKGLEPIIVTTVLNVNRLREHMKPSVEQLAYGMVAAAEIGRVAVKGGETAELGNIIQGYGDPEKVLQYEWSATVHAIGHQDRLLDGSRIQAGDDLVALEEGGFRANGMSLVRSVLEQEYGPEWHDKTFGYGEDRKLLGELVLQPSIIYTPVLVDAVGGYDLRRKPQAMINGAAHITGGGIPEKVGDMLAASGLGASISEPYEASDIMKHVQELAGIDDEEMYQVCNGGQGMIVATRNAEKFIEVAMNNGRTAKRIGEVSITPGIRMRSGLLNTGKKLEFPTAA